MNDSEKTLDDLLQSLSPDALLALALVWKDMAATRTTEAESLTALARKAAELAKFKGLNG